MTGYEGNYESKYFTTGKIYDSKDISKTLIGLSGEQIVEKLENNYDFPRYLKKHILRLAETYKTWYYYPENTKITIHYCEDF
jgi:hypothetical protein